MPGPDLSVVTLDSPADPEVVGAIRSIVDEATAHDGTSPVNESFRLHLSAGAVGSHLALAADGSGFAMATGDELVVVVRPSARRQGLGRALAVAVMESSPHRSWRAWAHGDLPGARALLTGLGLSPVRVLLRMGRGLEGFGGFETAASRPPQPPERDGSSTTGVSTGSTTGLGSTTVIREFRVGEDEKAFLAANAAAFASHPEQGRLDMTGLMARMAQPWFDPSGLLLAESDGRILGFHWTKLETPAVGEVYVLGVVPDGRGHGLASSLLRAGLAHLRSRGAERVELYVDEDNETAVNLYERLDFGVFDRDVRYESEIHH